MAIEIRSAPHIKTPRSVELIMRQVVWSLLPICAFFIYQYGLSALALIVTVTATCLLSERLFNRMAGRVDKLWQKCHIKDYRFRVQDIR